jgi:hypothetical protein
MPPPLRRRLRLARRFAFYAVAIGLVCVALDHGAHRAVDDQDAFGQRLQQLLRALGV